MSLKSQCLIPEFLKLCRRITHVHESGKKWTTEQQMLRIHEEVAEAHMEMKNKDVMKLSYELCDVMLSTITMFHKLGMSDKEIEKFMTVTLEKIPSRLDTEEDTDWARSAVCAGK